MPAIEPAAIVRARHAAGPAGRRRARCRRSRPSPPSEGVRRPAIAVFGPVARLHERLQLGRAAAARRAARRGHAGARAGERARARLRALGAEVVEAPAIRIVPLDGPAPDLERYDLVCLTSPNGVRLLFERLAAAGLRRPRRSPASRVAAIGPGTAAALAEHGIVADVVPERFVAEGLVEALADVPVERALIARAAEARDVLADALRERGAEVDVVALYETVAEPLSEEQLAAVAAADYVTFTSSSTVRFFLDAAGERLGDRTRAGQHRPGDERRAARARPRAARRGGAARHRRRRARRCWRMRPRQHQWDEQRR